MAEDEAWSSGESESEECDPIQSDLPEVDLEDPDYFPGKIFTDNSYFSSIKDFTGKAKLVEDLPLGGTDPVDFFNVFFDDSLLQRIVNETNRYESQNPSLCFSHMKNWSPLTIPELKKFLGLSILMGHVRKGELKDYWSTDPLLSTPIFRKVMTRDRYLQILRYLHFQNNEDILNHPLKKVKPIIDDLQHKFSNSITPGKNLCIDESLLLWKGRLKFKQYIPLKRHRFGVKFFELVDCLTGFILGFIIYTGSDTDYKKFDLGVTGDIVAHFLEPYFRKGHIVYIDNWYSSPLLAEFLHDQDTGVCGTVKKNRKGLPKLTDKLERGEVQIGHNQVWMYLRWKDKRDVHMLTTAHELDFCPTGKKHYQTKEEIIKPTCVNDYNHNMGGIDNIDKMLSITESVRKTLKWYKKVFFHLVDLSLINAHALYELQNEEKISFPSFRLKVVRSFLNLDENDMNFSFSRNVDIPTRLIGRHFPRKIVKRRRCHLCSLRKTRTDSQYECSNCKVSLCAAPCFEEYHTLEQIS